jgi:hypothetical protein
VYNKNRGDIHMEKNVGKKDAMIRYGVGVVFLILAFATQFFWIFLILGIISFATAYFGKCGLYKLFGINTCKLK